MTVSYTGDVANGSSFGCFWKILGRWKGSVYKLIWRELIAYLFLYFVINAIYRLGMTEDQRRTFEKVKVYCSKQIESIPMSFVLGFYVSLIVKRWWDQYWILPMPDSLALYISASIHGQDEGGRIYRRTIMRYAMLAYIICLQRISFRVKKRFPTLQHLVDSRFMTESEKKIFDSMDQKIKVLKFWMPVVWASNLINRARREGRIHSDHMVQTMITELSDFRRKLGRVMVYDTVSVPLVYTQVVTLAVYTYFVAALIGRQWVSPPNPSTIYPGYELDLYFPIFLSLQFIFYIGWLKVAETLINPFGEDDDDFELNWLIDRHFKVSYLVVDEMHEEHPELLKDEYWEQVVPQDLPYNHASEHFRRHEPQGSTASLKIKPNESVYADLTSVKRHSVVPEEVYADYESVTDSPLPDARKSWIQRQWSRVGSLRSTSSSSSRNRAHSHGHGPLPLSIPPHAGGHRPSLYERILSRRSSKDHRNSNRYLPNKAFNGTLTIAKEGNSALMPHPNSRPRVPTPDVTKENPIHFLSALDKPRAIYSNENPITTTATATNPGYGSPVASAPPITQLQPNGLVNGTVNPIVVNSTLVTSSTPISKRDMLPPPYDPIMEGRPSPSPPPILGGTILSPIAENDGSPYSTSSTTRSSKSTNYPTTTSIFGRKHSPPPLEELPPVPPVTVTAASSTNSSMKSDHLPFLPGSKVQRNGRMIIDDMSGRNELSPSSVLNELEAVLKETVLDGRMNEAFEHDHDDFIEEDNNRAYMTIAEIGESKAELEQKLLMQLGDSQSHNQNQPQAQHSRQEQEIPPTLPHPRIPTTGGISHLRHIQSTSHSHSPSQQTVQERDEPPERTASVSSSTSTEHASVSNQNSPTPKDNDNDDDDGYDERGSYNEDEESNHGSLISMHHNSNNINSHDLLALAPPIHPRGGSYDKSTSTEDDPLALNRSSMAAKQSDSSSSSNSDHSTVSGDNDSELLLSPKRRKKGGEKSSQKSGGEGKDKTPGPSKDCEVFV